MEEAKVSGSGVVMNLLSSLSELYVAASCLDTQVPR